MWNYAGDVLCFSQYSLVCVALWQLQSGIINNTRHLVTFVFAVLCPILEAVPSKYNFGVDVIYWTRWKGGLMCGTNLKQNTDILTPGIIAPIVNWAWCSGKAHLNSFHQNLKQRLLQEATISDVASTWQGGQQAIRESLFQAIKYLQSPVSVIKFKQKHLVELCIFGSDQGEWDKFR